ncbi:MAG: UDP-N-acetylmuramate--L-alanine ligase, partial [Deltaproteobacteria bacterium]|nr:UDP-N-acetylmuramate--L-alanine ligase [Deltaproteobacteria bacterium]
VKACRPEKRLVVVFQPHRYTRTQALMDRFVIAFNDADVLVVTPIYPAGEQPIEGITAENLVKGIKDHGHKEVIFCADQQAVVPTLKKLMQPGDLVLTLGAGNIHKEGERLLANSLTKHGHSSKRNP